jgi:hypothetical protein
MDPFSANCSKLRRFIAEHLGITSVTMLVAFLVMASLAALVASSDLACSSPTSTTPTPTLTPPPPHGRLPTPTPSPTPAPTLLPSVTLEEPEDGSYLDCGSEVTLRWSCPGVLQANAYYRLSVKGQAPSLFHHTVYHREDHFTLPALSPGEYNWAVAIVRSTDPDKYELVSEESEWRSFEIAPPCPVVHAIWPTSMVQATGGPVLVSGENFTHSLTLTIGVPLQMTSVNSTTITATIPMTLEIGEYPVIVKDSSGAGVSSVSFIVSELPLPPPTSTPSATPMPMPSITRTPIPPAYPPPILGGIDIFGCSLTFHWSWAGQLAEDEYFAPGVGIGAPGESRTWTKETQYGWILTEPGEYVWEVAICRGDPETHICNQLAVSERGSFTLLGCGGKDRP